MSLRTFHSHQSYFSLTYTSPWNYQYDLNSPQLYQLPIPFDKPLAITNEYTQLEQIINERRHSRNHCRHSNSTTRLQDNIPKISTVSDNYGTRQMHRSVSQKNEKHRHFVKQQSLQKPPMTYGHYETTPRNRQFSVFSSITNYCRVLRDKAGTISNEELTDLLNSLILTLKGMDKNDQHQQLPILIDILDALIQIRPTILISVSRNKFFSMLETSFINILRRWRRLSLLSDRESLMIRNMTKLRSIMINNTEKINLLPSWLSDSTLLETISGCLSDIASSRKFLNEKNKRDLKHFIHLIDTFVDYQKRLNDEDDSDKDKLLELLDPILQCLTSKYYIDTLTKLQIDLKSMTIIQKFFLLKCPSFLISYTGSRLETSMKSLLSTMLPQYVTVLDRLVPSASSWKSAMTRAIFHLLEIINNGANQSQINAKLISGYLSLINHVLKLVDEPIFYNNLSETLSNIETTFMNTAISFLVNMTREPVILAHIKQCQVTPIFLRLTSCQYEPLVLNVYTLLAYTTHEEDIKAMQNPGRLLAVIIKSLRTAMDRTPNNKSHIEQSLETLKGLVQHDQIKNEIIKQNTLPLLLECAEKLNGRELVLIFEVLWALTFFEDIAQVLRANSEFLERSEAISKDNNNEPLKKAAAGLVWKLIQEPAFLEKVAKQEEEANADEDKIITTTEVIIGTDGENKVVTTTKRSSLTPSERTYRYDFMISYCHVDKELTYKIHKFLIDNGFKVWIDLDNMYGPAMSAMADAVENSEFVIMCMSDSYKQSTYCQAEAEYAFKCRRRLIPLIMRPGYKPDGWLGFLIGSRMYVDYGRFDFETACEKLMTEISLQRSQPLPAALINALGHDKPADTLSVPFKPGQDAKQSSSQRSLKKPPITKDILSSVLKARQSKVDFIRKPVNQWTESDVLDFLITQGLNQLLPLCEGMHGRALLQLYKICTSHRLRAYSVLKDELITTNKVKLSLNIYSRFLSAIEEVINSPLEPSPSLPVNYPMASLPVNYPMASLPVDYPMPFQPAPNPNMSYDFFITSDASPLDTLKMVENYSSQLLDSLHRRITNVK